MSKILNYPFNVQYSYLCQYTVSVHDDTEKYFFGSRTQQLEKIPNQRKPQIYIKRKHDRTRSRQWAGSYLLLSY